MPEHTEPQYIDEKTKDEQVKLWHSRLELARRYQKKHGDTDGRWTKNIKALAGDFNSRSELGDEAIDVNLVRSTVKTVLPPMWVTEPHITVKATTPEFNGADNLRAAEVTEIEVNYWIQELKVRHQVKKIMLDAECTNLGYAYVGYVKDKSDIEDGEGRRTENQPQIRHRRPFVKRMSPRNVLVPPGYADLEDAPWIGLVFHKPLRHVKSKYGEERTKDLRATLSFKDAVAQREDTAEFCDYLESDDAGLVETINVWDKETKKVYILAKDHDQFLEDPKAWPYDVEGFPLCPYRPEEIPDEYHGTPPTSYYLPQNKELNATRTAMRKRRNRTKAVIFMDADVSREVREAYAKADDGEIVSVPLNDADIRSKMYVDQGLPLDQGDIVYDSVIKGDVREQSGLGAEQRGSGDPSIRSATASANVEKGVQIRSSDTGDAVRTLYLGIAIKLWMILKRFPNEERTRMIAGPGGRQVGAVRYKLKELHGEFNFDFDFAAMINDTPTARASQAILNYNLLRADPRVDPDALLIDIFKSQNKKNPEKYMLRLRTPDEEFQRMISGRPVETHEQDDHETHLAEHTAQAEQIDQAIAQATTQQEREAPSTAQILLIAHMSEHVERLQALQTQAQRQAGKPVAENMLRNQVRANSGSETEAELTGQPLGPEQMVQ